MSAAVIAPVRRSASGRAACWASGAAERASPPAVTWMGAPARRAARSRSAASACAGNAAEPGAKAKRVDGRGRGVAGAKVVAGTPASRGGGGAEVGRAGTEPLTTGASGAAAVGWGWVRAAGANAGGGLGSFRGGGGAAGRAGAGLGVAPSNTIVD